MEIWKDIDGYDGYQVSNYGRVRTHNKITHTDCHGYRKWKDRVLKPKKSKDNTLRVDLWKDGKHKDFLVYRLVAYAFLGKPENDSFTVNHKDGNRLNNCVENLEWLTLADNIRHGYRTGLYDSICIKCKLLAEDGGEYNFNSEVEASRFLGWNKGYIGSKKKKTNSVVSKDGKKYKLITNL